MALYLPNTPCSIKNAWQYDFDCLYVIKKKEKRRWTQVSSLRESSDVDNII